MNTYEMVERIIDLTEKGKTKWHSLYDDSRRYCQYTGWYKGIQISLQVSLNFPNGPLTLFSKKEIELKIQGISVVVEKKQAQRLLRAVEKATSETKRKIASDKLQEAGDILKG